jgi:hypothetical protein
MNVKEKLSPRRVPSDGNEFFVYMSMSLLDRHDQHAQIRERVWNAFCLKVFNCKLFDVLESGGSVVGRTPGLMEWATTPPTDAQVLKLVRTNACEGTRSPLFIVIPLVVECYGVGVVLYETAKGGNGDRWEPSRVWHPVKETKNSRYIHLLTRGSDTLELLVRAAKDGQGIVPNRVVGSLPLRMKADPKVEPWESLAIRNNAVYQLEVSPALFVCAYLIREKGV